MAREKVIVLSVNRYSYKKENRQVEGCNVAYFNPSPDSIFKESDLKGSPPLSVSCDYSFYDRFRVVPGIYELDFRQRPGQNNRPTNSLGDEVKFLSSLEFKSPAA